MRPNQSLVCAMCRHLLLRRQRSTKHPHRGTYGVLFPWRRKCEITRHVNAPLSVRRRIHVVVDPAWIVTRDTDFISFGFCVCQAILHQPTTQNNHHTTIRPPPVTYWIPAARGGGGTGLLWDGIKIQRHAANDSTRLVRSAVVVAPSFLVRLPQLWSSWSSSWSLPSSLGMRRNGDSVVCSETKEKK
jgi:hypothetical protein